MHKSSHLETYSDNISGNKNLCQPQLQKRKPIKYQKSTQDGPLRARQSPCSDVLNRDRSVITSTSWHQQSWVKPHMYSHSAFICSSANDLFCVCVLHIFDAVLFKICHRQTPAKVLKNTFCGCSHYKTSSWHTHAHTYTQKLETIPATLPWLLIIQASMLTENNRKLYIV